MYQSKLIGIIGGSGSGKSTILGMLRNTFSEEEVCIVNMDDYYRPREEQHTDSNGIKNFDLPDSLDGEKFARDVKQLLVGQKLEVEEYTFNNDKAVPEIKVYKPAPVIIAEGLFLFSYPSLYDLLDYKVYIEVREAIRLIRRIHRDRIERNYPLDDVLYRFEHHVLPSHDSFIKKYKSSCDLIINNDGAIGIGLDQLSNTIRGYLDQAKL